MATSDIVGSAGVALILVAFLLNLAGRMDRDSLPYLVLNLVGAVLTCAASIAIGFWPFAVLEAVWAAAAFVALAGLARRAQA